MAPEDEDGDEWHNNTTIMLLLVRERVPPVGCCCCLCAFVALDSSFGGGLLFLLAKIKEVPQANARCCVYVDGLLVVAAPASNDTNAAQAGMVT